MKKLVKGIVEFRQNSLATYRKKFAGLAAGQFPDTLFITCSDSRVAPNWFASTDPGDLFVVRNVGNLIPGSGKDGHSIADESEGAAIEFALVNLNVSEIIVCGHSECGAMHAMLEGRDKIKTTNLRAWLRHAEPSLAGFRERAAEGLSEVNRLSQFNVLQQLRHLETYPIIKERQKTGRLRLHAWWFELHTANLYAFEPQMKKFVLIDEEEASRILASLK